MMISMYDTLAGYRIIVRPYPRQEVAWHRKRRIAKKWRKRYGPKYVYEQVNTQEVLVSEAQRLIYCYPATADALRRALAEMQGETMAPGDPLRARWETSYRYKLPAWLSERWWDW